MYQFENKQAPETGYFVAILCAIKESEQDYIYVFTQMLKITT
jgi:hypothetical protein